MLQVKVKKTFREKGKESPDGGAGEDSGAAFSLDVDFTVAAGVTILFGASGSGKTTTLKLIAGLVEPDAGRIEIEGRVVFDAGRRVNLPARARGVGYVFQNLALFPHLTALQNIEFAVRGVGRVERRARALSLLEQFRAVRVKDRLPRNISGGEAQRVALARALAGGPRLLLLDEPLSALDEPTKRGIIEDLKRVNRELRLPILYVTHSRDEVFALGESALIFEGGRVVAEGVPSEVFDAPARASVARLTGIENVYEGEIVKKDSRAGTMMVRLSEAGGGGGDGVCLVEAPLGHGGEGGRVHLAVPSGDILIASEEPRGLSARNVFEGVILSIEGRSEQTLVRVRSGVVWAVSVTRQSAADLKLEEGRKVWLVFKTYSCRLLDAPR